MQNIFWLMAYKLLISETSVRITNSMVCWYNCIEATQHQAEQLWNPDWLVIADTVDTQQWFTDGNQVSGI
ncbi:MAG: hypothetical protein A2X46_16345 [Lentisphaerae bacterium GWF2_57_35]|nr:MAG: hypothetical protein A2X46_16345 [Lentisphaerae bacterium GWF2_57_35]